MGQLFNLLRDTDVLAWDFFLGRLDLLSMEAHVGLENAADLGAFPTGNWILFACCCKVIQDLIFFVRPRFQV